MKGLLSIRGTLIAMLLLVVALGAGTAQAGPQEAASSQVSFERQDGATIVGSSICTENDTAFTVYGSGWGPGELILLSVIRGEYDSLIWYAGPVNAAGAIELEVNIRDKANKKGAKVRYPGAGLYTLEALGTSGRLTSTPVVFAEDKCNAEAEVAAS